MAKIMEIIAKETKGKNYHTYKYSYDSIGLPSIDYDDDPNKIMKWKDFRRNWIAKADLSRHYLFDFCLAFIKIVCFHKNNRIQLYAEGMIK